MESDRRHNRSQNPLEALRHLLEACRTRGQFEAVVIADEQGLLVGASETAGDVRELARAIPRASRDASVTRVPFRVKDELLYAAGFGPGSAAALIDAVFGARRILAS